MRLLNFAERGLYMLAAILKSDGFGNNYRIKSCRIESKAYGLSGERIRNKCRELFGCMQNIV